MKFLVLFLLLSLAAVSWFLFGHFKGWQRGRRSPFSRNELEKLSNEDLSDLDTAVLNEMKRRMREGFDSRERVAAALKAAIEGDSSQAQNDKKDVQNDRVDGIATSATQNDRVDGVATSATQNDKDEGKRNAGPFEEFEGVGDDRS